MRVGLFPDATDLFPIVVSAQSRDQPEGSVANNTDLDDTDVSVGSEAQELACPAGMVPNDEGCAPTADELFSLDGVPEVATGRRDLTQTR